MGNLYERAKRQAEKGADFRTMIVDAELMQGHSPLTAEEAATLRQAWKDAWPIRKHLEEKKAASIAPGRREA